VDNPAPHAFNGFVRAPDGTISTFKGPQAVWTIAYNINNAGRVAGYYTLADNTARAYLRQPDGKLKTLFFDGAATTVATAINNNGAIGGYWFDTSNRSHGCLWLQQ